MRFGDEGLLQIHALLHFITKSNGVFIHQLLQNRKGMGLYIRVMIREATQSARHILQI